MNSKSKTPAVADYGRVAAVNDDVWAEILVRFPAKFVTRLKLVSKRWLSLISGDQFRRLHTLRRHKPEPSLLLRTRTLQFFYFNPIINGENLMIPYNFPFHNPKILSSCNGLMLLQCDNPQTDYYVYNPTTKQSRKIILDYDCDYPSIMGLSLAFDPSKSPHYKIVCVRGSRKELPVERSYRIQVYDSVSHTWNLCLESFTDSGNINFSYGVHCHNSIYWKMSDTILSFDIDEHVIGSLPRPEPEFTWPERWVDAFRVSQLQESNGHLYLFVTDVGGTMIALWEVQADDHSQWFLKYHERLPCSFGTRYSTSLLRFISGSDGKEETTSFLMSHVPGKIRAYNFLDKSCDELVDLTNQPFYHEKSLQFDSKDVYEFGESLAVV